MNKLSRVLIVTIAVILFLWAILTVIAESKGRRMQWQTGSEAADKKVLIIYDPDPFYNLDEQVCRIFAAVMAKHNMHVTVSTVAAAHDQRDNIFDLYVFCANTYNWRPDWAVSGFISKLETLKGRPVVAVTLGSGSTKASQKHLEQSSGKKVPISSAPAVSGCCGPMMKAA